MNLTTMPEDGKRGMGHCAQDVDAAHSKVLNFIRCKCKETTKKQCGTKPCSCKKNGLKCVMACQGYRGQICSNIDHVVNDNEETDVDL